jgi:hypothetical protein
MKYLFATLVLLFTLTGFAHAAADIVTEVKSTTTNSVVVLIKNTGPAGISVTGSNMSTVSTRISAFNTVTNVVDYNFSGPNIAGGQSRDVVVTNLAPSTQYKITITAEEGATRNTKELTATTKAEPQQNLPPRPLYVSFVSSTPTTTADAINNITIKNTGIKDFNAVVTLKTTSGTVVGTETRLVGAGQTYNLLSFFNLNPNTTYSLSMTGTEVGSNRRFETAIYPGGITTKNNPAPAGAPAVSATNSNSPQKEKSTSNECLDNQDNDGDGKADRYGLDKQINDGKDYGLGVNKGDGILDLEPDPSCFSESATQEVADDVVSSIIPCTDKCTLSDVFRLLNNIISFFFKTLLIPIFIIMLMYAGWQYLTAEGNPKRRRNTL